MTCGCVTDPDGLVAVGECHEQAIAHNEWRYRQLLDAELDEVIRELAGRSPTRIERKQGAVGNFAIARTGVAQP